MKKNAPQMTSQTSSPAVLQAASQKRKAKKNFSALSIVRIGVQILFFVWLPSLYIMAFSGVQEVFTGIVTGTFSLAAVWPDLLPFVAIVPVTIFAGRFFCGWMCAFGSLTDWIYRILSRWTKNRIKISKSADRALKGIKYAVLIALLLLGWFAGSFSLSAMSPWDAFGMLFTVGAVPAVAYVFQSLLPGLVLLVFVLLASAFVERFFCRYLCPMGAFFALISRGRIVKINKPREKCGKCQICTKNCAMGIPLCDMDVVKSGECIGCMKCVEVCPRKNVTVQSVRIPVNPIAISVVIVALITGIFLFATYLTDSTANSIESANTSASTTSSDTGSAAAGTSAGASVGTTAGTTDASSNGTTAAPASASASASSAATAATAATTTTTTAAAASAGLYKDGTYQGSGTGFRGGTTTVKVTITNGNISGIAVVSYQDDAPYFNKAFSTISPSVISAQNASVDVVSHATYSSNGIIGAIKEALAKAAL